MLGHKPACLSLIPIDAGRDIRTKFLIAGNVGAERGSVNVLK
ncbi:MAG TPA: hypothetical protein VFP64_07730 [Pyrinomonadaceae bacterium]|nr:hypothetical protein [Pyrinomonadaceae bacterium]